MILANDCIRDRGAIFQMNNELIKALQSPSVYPHNTCSIKVIETHISWVILTGDYAYKIKKPVDFGFLDFTSLAQRKQYCEAELRLNSRSAPDLYLAVVAITGTSNQPVLDGDGPVLEYAVKMKQFESSQLYSELGDAGKLSFEQIDVLAGTIAGFHRQIDIAGPDDTFGTPHQVFDPMQLNFDLIKQYVDSPMQIEQIKHLEAWTQSTYIRLIPTLKQRHAEGKIRECHGDMHLGNITEIQGQAVLFDCIEFNDDFRWVDVISDIAFLIMDLEDHGLGQFANRFLNNYFEHTGDYSGLKVLAFYKTYRAVVRAKVALLTLNDTSQSSVQRDVLSARYQHYMDLAESYCSLPNRVVLTMHGFSGSGKSTVALRLVDSLGLVRIRSDVERKRLFGLEARAHSSLADNIYSESATHQTYEKICQLAGDVLDAGLSVIIDATNLKRWQRQAIQQLADKRGVPVVIIDCQVPAAIIEQRLEKRSLANTDASEADFSVMTRQVDMEDPLSTEEQKHTLVIYGDNLAGQIDQLARKIRPGHRWAFSLRQHSKGFG